MNLRSFLKRGVLNSASGVQESMSSSSLCPSSFLALRGVRICFIRFILIGCSGLRSRCFNVGCAGFMTGASKKLLQLNVLLLLRLLRWLLVLLLEFELILELFQRLRSAITQSVCSFSIIAPKVSPKRAAVELFLALEVMPVLLRQQVSNFSIGLSRQMVWLPSFLESEQILFLLSRM